MRTKVFSEETSGNKPQSYSVNYIFWKLVMYLDMFLLLMQVVKEGGALSNHSRVDSLT